MCEVIPLSCMASRTPKPKSRRLAIGEGKVLPMLPGGAECIVALRALAEDTRLRIIGLLLESPFDVGQIASRLNISQYNVSKHLRILREAGVLDVEKDGRVRRYTLPAALRARPKGSSVLDLGCCRFRFEPPQPPAVRRRRKMSH